MPNWKKVVVSGSAANLHSLNVSTDVTASNISSSGNIFGNLSENSSTSFKTVVVDPSTGQFYKTGSYGGGGGGTGNGFPFTGDARITGSLLISASNNTSQSLQVQGSGSTIFSVQGSQGQLFSVTDDLLHSVLEVGDISGDTLFKVSGSGLVTIPVGNLSGSATATASYGAFKGDGSQLTNLPSTDPFPYTGDAQITGSLLLSGSQNIKDGNLTISGSSTYSILITGSSTQNTSNGSEIAILDTTRHTGNSYSYGPKITLKANPNDSTYGTTTTINAISTVSGGIGLGSRTVINSNRELVYNNTTTGYNGVGLRIRNNTSPANRNTEHIFAMQNQSGGYAHIARSQMGTGRIFLHGLGTSGVYGMMLKANQNQYLIIGPQTSGTDGSEVVKITSTGFKTTGFIEAVGNITASGNISASGNITSAGLTLPTFTTNRVPFIGSNGELTTDLGFEYNSTTDQLKVHSLDVVHLTSSFITSSTIETSGSNIFGDDTTDTQTLIGTTKMTGSAQITGSTSILGDTQITGSLLISGSKIHLRGESASPGPILELESINGGSGKDVYVKVGDSNENYAYVFGADDTGNTFRISKGSYSGATLGADDKFIIDGNNIEFPAGNISGSITSTASFGTYIGDGSQLTGLISSSYAVTASHALNVTTPTLQQVTNQGASTTNNISLPNSGQSIDFISNAGIYGRTGGSYPGLHIASGDSSNARIWLGDQFNTTGPVTASFLGLGKITGIHTIEPHTNYPLILRGGPGPNDSNDGVRIQTADASNVYINRFEIESDANTVDAYFTNINGLGINDTTPTAMLDVNGNINTTSNITASGHVSGSATSTASFGHYIGDGSELTGISSTPFPFIGDAEITGSLDISGSGGLKVKGPIEVSMTASSGVIPLSIKTISDLSSDVLIQIRDDGGSFDLMTFDSEGRFNMRGTSTDAEGAGFYASNGGVVHDHVKMGFVSGKASLSISANAGDRFKVLTNGSNTSPMVGLTGRGTLALGTQVSSATLPNEARTNTMFIKTGTAPSTAEADNIQFFAQDVNSVAGTASPTFLTEDGTIIQLGVTSSLSYVSASAFKGDGSQLTGISSNPFPFTGDAEITGSLKITGSFEAQSGTSLLNFETGASTGSADSKLSITATGGAANVSLHRTDGKQAALLVGTNSVGLHYDETGKFAIGPANNPATASAFTTPTSFVMDSAGKVGINTTSPTARLDVVGKIKTSVGLESAAYITADSYIQTNSHITASGNISSSGYISASHIHLTGGENSVITVPNSTSGFTFAAAGGNSTVDIFGTDFRSNLVEVPIGGTFKIGSYNTVLKQNYLQLYGTAYLTGTTTGYFTIAGSTGTSFNIGARLGVIGTTNDNTASALKIQNSDSVNILDIVNDKTIKMSGSAQITGSLIVSSSVVDFTNATAISGSIFSGSFVGDGNGLRNISSTSLNGISLGLSTLVGDGALSAQSYGTVVGKSATSSGGGQNVVVGSFSNAKTYGVSIGHSTVGGNNTVAIGYNAGNTSGENNVLVGYQPGNSTSGDYNISLGYLAGYNQTTGDGNITIGSGSVGVAGESNQLRIGHGLHGALISGSLSDGGVMIRGQVSASSYIGDGSGLTNLPSIYTSDGNILSTRTINDRAGGFTGTAGSNALKMNVRNSGALLVAGYQNNGDPGTTNHLIQWGPGATDGSMNVRGKLGLTGGGGRIDLTNSGGSQYFTVAQTGITSTVSLSATTITNNSAVADTKLTGSFTGSFVGDGSGLTNLPAASAGSTAGRVVFTTTNGELTSETGFTYDATTDRLTVPNLTTTTFTASFITSSTIETSGSNIFGDDTTDTQTLIGTTLMTGSAQISGSLTFGGTAPTDLYTSGPKIAIDTSAVGGIKAKGALYLLPSADSSYNSRILFGTTNSLMSFGRRADSSTAIRGVTQNYGWQLFGITHGYNNPGSGFHYTTNLPDTTFADNLTISGSGTYMSEPLKVHGSGSSVFEVIGTEGTLFSVDDDLDGTLLDVKDRSGIPVLQASASGEIYLGQSPQSLYTTAVISSTIADVTQSLYRLDTSSYGGAFFDYIAHSGSNARGGTVSSVWTPGGSVVFSETTTTHIGDTSNLNLVVHFSQSQAQLACYADTSQYNIKVITRAI